MEKTVVIINGSGGVGKDTICSCAAQIYCVHNISSITPIVKIAHFAGWDGEKTPASRRMLSRLKEVFTEYNDLPLQYCISEYQSFLKSQCELLFVHIREPKEIVRFRNAVQTRCITLLVRRPALEEKRGLLGNASDDEVQNFCYDYEFVNDMPLAQLAGCVKSFFQKVLD